jgi:hypothetical protein
MSAPDNEPTAAIADMIASVDYWDDPAPVPILDAGGEDRDAYFAAIREATSDTEKAKEIGVTAMSLSGGGSFEKLEEGTEFPDISGNPRQLIRLVEDSLVVVIRGSKHHRTLKDLQAGLDGRQREGIYPGFDVLAERAMDPRYVHVSPPYDLRSAGVGRAMSISRSIHYMRPVFEGRLGLCVGSIFVQTPKDLEHVKPDVVPMVPIGSTYVRKNRVSKIARADVVEPTGIMWRGDDTPKKPDRRKKHFAAGLLPRLAPGLGT